MTSKITPGSIRQTLRHLRGDLAALEGLLCEVRDLPPVHATRLALKLDDMRREVGFLIDFTQRLATLSREGIPQ